MTVLASRNGPRTATPRRQVGLPCTYADMVLAIVVFVLGSLIAGGIAIGIAELLVESGQEYEDSAGALSALLVANLLVQELLLLGGVWWFAIRKYRLSWADSGIRPMGTSWRFPAGLAVAALAIIYSYTGLMALIGISEPETPSLTYESPGPLAILIAGAVFMAPVIEELFFRGFVFGGLVRRHTWVLAAAVSGLLFGIAHMSPFVVAPFLAVGFLLAWAYWRTGSLKSGIIAHLIINAFSTAVGIAVA